MLFKGACGTGKQQDPEQAPPENLRTQRGRKLLREKKGDWEGACGTGKQQGPEQAPGEFTDATRPEIAPREKRGLGGGLRNWNRRKNEFNSCSGRQLGDRK